ncbi:hypothetical protein DTO013E5_3275 [Penicillium roqueforti]|uniref:Regulator of Vps4 activity in the MVB pathway n=1 Tax=Penicillium roqueforti (strain FM164) TaxID=1365484 RepID=W6QEC6_PENRF|nr:hypothetical protein CBS147372_2928 [Penicillium roqueforti]CDM34815.1 Domain of unknown function DUF292, eukaryotic [Penicillium roqueforti FM164]KAI2744009.1 hypothetical protein DTO012A1_2995 [Penicillium roqueforti]KAI2756238.1 hypothetical protein DTO013F2_986 [Penicillium roqueforti]KAI2774651.1 hypothetical protein DTO012A8_837 [Penicillium roqueforti]
MPPSAQTTRLVSTLRLLIPRLRLLQKKDTASSVVQRRELSQLLSEGRDASARIRVENVIATDIAVEVMEMVELYCELLLARANVLDQMAFSDQGTRARLRAKELLKKRTQEQAGATVSTTAGVKGAGESTGSIFGFSWLGGGAQKKEAERAAPITGSGSPADDSGDGLADDDNPYLDTALDEAATVVFYAWHRFPHEVREFTMLRTMLGERYGKEFMTLAQDNKIDTVKVPDRLLKGLRVRPPGRDLVESYLREIAKAYHVEWHGAEEELGSAPPEFVDDLGDGDDGDAEEPQLPQTPGKQQGDSALRPNLAEARRASETSELTKATPPRGLTAGRSPVSVAPPAPRTDNPNPRVKLPGTEGKAAAVSREDGASKSNSNNSGIPELDELTRRFADLKRRP